MGLLAISKISLAHDERLMFGTVAEHKLGDVSRFGKSLEWHLCRVRDTGEEFVGQWVLGFCFIGIKFSKATTRELSADEMARVRAVFEVRQLP